MWASSWQITSAARFFSREGGRGRIEQQQRLAEEDRAGVLHGSELEVGHRHQVELRVGIGQVEVALEAGQALPRRLEAEGREVLLPGVCQTRISVGPTRTGRERSSSPTASATR